MSRIAGVREHIAKAEQFLEAARAVLDDHPDAAASCAVTAGIHANDAVCLARLGRLSTARNHQDALALARSAGPEGRAAAVQLERLIGIKNKAQYDASSIGAAGAGRALRAAETLVDIAKRVRAG